MHCAICERFCRRRRADRAVTAPHEVNWAYFQSTTKRLFQNGPFEENFMLTLIATLGIVASAYFLWRISEQLPDLVFRISEIQRDLADLRRNSNQDQN